MGSIAVADLLASGLTIQLKNAEERQNVGLTNSKGFNTVGVIGRREAKEAKNGNLYLRWHVTGAFSMPLVGPSVHSNACVEWYSDCINAVMSCLDRSPSGNAVQADEVALA